MPTPEIRNNPQARSLQPCTLHLRGGLGFLPKAVRAHSLEGGPGPVPLKVPPQLGPLLPSYSFFKRPVPPSSLKPPQSTSLVALPLGPDASVRAHVPRPRAPGLSVCLQTRGCI